MQLKQLQFFVVSVDMGSFKAAAKVLYTSQPHISKTIKNLEEELGMSLLNRQASGVVLTEDGGRVYEYATKILYNTELIGNLRQKNTFEQLAVAANASLHISALFQEFYNENSAKNRQFTFLEGTVEEVMQLIHQNKAEVGFVFVSKRQIHIFHEILKQKRLKFTLLSETKPVLYVGQGNTFYQAKSIRADQLHDVKLVHRCEDFFSLTNHLGHIKNELGELEKARKTMITDSDYAMLQFIQKGEYACLGSSCDAEEVKQMKIRAVPVDAEDERILFGYIDRQRDGLSSLGEKFCEYVKENC